MYLLAFYGLIENYRFHSLNTVQVCYLTVLDIRNPKKDLTMLK